MRTPTGWISGSHLGTAVCRRFPYDGPVNRSNLFWLITSWLLSCVDEQTSAEVRFWGPDDGRPDLIGTYRSIGGLRVDPSRAGQHKLFRIKNWEMALIASGEIKDAFERERIVGAVFEAVL